MLGVGGTNPRECRRSDALGSKHARIKIQVRGAIEEERDFNAIPVEYVSMRSAQRSNFVEVGI